MIARWMAALLAAGLIANGAGAAEEVTECDKQAAHPSDPGKILPDLTTTR